MLLGLGAIAFFLFKKAFSTGDYAAARGPAQKSLSNLNVKDARPNDVLLIRGEGDEYEDMSFDVDRRNRYESGGDTWYELSGLYKGRRVYLEWYEDDELEIYLDKGEDVYLDQIGLDERKLSRIDAEESTSNFVEFRGQKWRYASSQEVGYYKDCLGNGEGFYTWEFAHPDGSQVIYVEKWEGEPFEAGIAHKIRPDKVTVLRK